MCIRIVVEIFNEYISFEFFRTLAKSECIRLQRSVTRLMIPEKFNDRAIVPTRVPNMMYEHGSRAVLVEFYSVSCFFFFFFFESAHRVASTSFVLSVIFELRHEPHEKLLEQRRDGNRKFRCNIGYRSKKIRTFLPFVSTRNVN